VLAPGGDLWLVLGDRHDGREWIGVERDPRTACLTAPPPLHGSVAGAARAVL
jgi:hypothetical protein